MSAEFLDQARCVLIVLFGNVSHDHALAFADKRQRRRAADAVRSASNERNLSCKISLPIRIHFRLIVYVGVFSLRQFSVAFLI
jgi:hypothetical protein